MSVDTLCNPQELERAANNIMPLVALYGEKHHLCPTCLHNVLVSYIVDVRCQQDEWTAKDIRDDLINVIDATLMHNADEEGALQ